jgi:hypothetical protein
MFRSIQSRQPKHRPKAWLLAKWIRTETDFVTARPRKFQSHENEKNGLIHLATETTWHWLMVPVPYWKKASEPQSRFSFSQNYTLTSRLKRAIYSALRGFSFTQSIPLIASIDFISGAYSASPLLKVAFELVGATR